jgi:hypothetical protein
MPIRCELEGRISPSRAALMSAEIATDAAKDVSEDWEGPEALFCLQFRETMQLMFGARYHGVGARVTQQ